MSLKVWIKAARLRTLPLAIAGAITGNLLALSETGTINKTTFLLSVLTAVFLQILSNYANDYGDFKNGADTKERTDRVMASGLISESKMKSAISVLILLTLILGISLLVKSIGTFDLVFFSMLLLGLGGILAAYHYTGGKRPYGYIGLGDLSVFIFFGCVSVLGTYFLQTKSLYTQGWWVASAIGLLSVGVLNVNNIRDIESDRLKNKITIPVLLGYKNAMLYQAFLLLFALLFLGLYVYFRFTHPLQLVFLILIPLFVKHFKALRQAQSIGRAAFNMQLKNLSLLTLFLCILFSLSQILIA